MTLKNLLGISLDAITADKASVAMLIVAAKRNIADAQLQGLSSENRFDAAYKAIMQMAMVALNANGYRTLKSKPGHHQTAIQTLPLTVGLAQPKVIVLDALRKQRALGAPSNFWLTSGRGSRQTRLNSYDRIAHRGLGRSGGRVEATSQASCCQSCCRPAAFQAAQAPVHGTSFAA